jgi:hypothetical protein
MRPELGFRGRSRSDEEASSSEGFPGAKYLLRRQTIQLEKNKQNLLHSEEDIHYGMTPRVIIQATSVPYNKCVLTTDKNCGQDAKTKT